ncbi:ATP-utilizing protein [Actinocatenispora thailandica]|uniref:ATP-utilizing protein n=1 Tax=Actinocatenispora thailandica TaxID=227318 RepID=A0A7R7DMB2_9ACTN|nr:hydantoinase/oxoprolinase family protein [Actinocatenispora thailandica]BCJ33992.1 ATP-utilizing protein [Actinocatenispora thailandica]
MTASRIRVGIDVGGTFTDAVALDARTLELLGQVKVRTTHRHADGVARGIIDALRELLDSIGATAGDVGFLAHGTTQATNALLEGDVATVGLVGVGRGLEGLLTRRLHSLGRIELAPGKRLAVRYAHVPVATEPADADAAVETVRGAGAEVVVGVQAFSVDDATGENAVAESARKRDLLATTTHEITKLYGLRKRARTAVVNASILPRMLDTADLVERSITDAGISAPLMVMRCDGGVMSLDEMRRRPLLTVLSGPAAGVAGALMAEKVSEGIFLETGGTSTDISVIRRGSVVVRHAKVGGHDTYLSSLDVRTVGVGGGSMVRARSGKVVDVGPRSAHIAGLEYACFADPAALAGARLATVAPMDGDPDDYVVVDADGGRFALTMTCAANILNLVPEGDHAYADPAAARLAFAPLAALLGGTVPDAARAVLDAGTGRVRAVVDELIAAYRLDKRGLRLVGGGGGAASVTPHLGAATGLAASIAAHNEVISPIGVALALVRESVERIVPNPSQQDVLAVRAEAERAVVAQGATPATVEVDVTVDAQTNTITAVATGATELRAPDRTGGDTVDRQRIAADSLDRSPAEVRLLAETPTHAVFGAEVRRGGALSRWVRPHRPVRVVDRDGVVRLQSPDAVIAQTTVGAADATLTEQITTHTTYGDGGSQLPAMRLLVGPRIVDLAGVTTRGQVLALARAELDGRTPDEPLVSITEVRR